MTDPFSKLLASLQSLFQWEAMRNHKYTNPLVQQLKEATDKYDPHSPKTFINLLEAIQMCSPRMKIWQVNLDTVKKCMDALAKLHHLPNPAAPSLPTEDSRFPFNKPNPLSEMSFTAWLSKRAGKPYQQIPHQELAQLLVNEINNHDRPGFSKKLAEHLQKYPDFLAQLIMESKKNFIKICNSRLILHLNDQQIARAIVQHIPALVQKKYDPFAQVDQLMHTLNNILSNGCSVATLLRNSKAKPILYNSVFFQIYESDSYKYRDIQAQHDPALKSDSPKLS